MRKLNVAVVPAAFAAAFIVVTCVGSALVACTPRESGNADAGVKENGKCEVDHDCAAGQLCDTDDNTCKDCDVVLKLPPPNNSCLPKCGNELGVGMPCTKNGKQCSHNSFVALFCTVDAVDNPDLVMCTGPCFSDSDCGTNSVCIGDPADPNSQKGCVPATCNGPGEGEGEGAAGEGEGEGEGAAQ